MGSTVLERPACTSCRVQIPTSDIESSLVNPRSRHQTIALRQTVRCYFCATKKPSLWENEGQSLLKCENELTKSL
nr:MAG TPA: hypothetical protein [Bacteriophage sp.]